VGRRIKGFSSLQGHDFKKYMSQEKLAEIHIKLLGLSHVQEEKSCRKTASMLKVHENTVQEWVRRFAQSGLKGLQRQPGQGSHKKIDKQKLPQIKEGILSLQSTFKGGRVRGQDIQKYLHDQWNVDYKLSTIYEFLHDLGIVWISARSKHPTSSQEAQDSFKKNLLKKLKNVCQKAQI
jgi:transposase